MEEAPFLSIFGWSAVAFDDDGLRGVYVLGNPDLLEPHFRTAEAPSAELPEEKSGGVSWRKRVEDLWHGFGQSAGGIPAAGADEQATEEPARGNFAQRFMNQIGLTLRQPEAFSHPRSQQGIFPDPL